MNKTQVFKKILGWICLLNFPSLMMIGVGLCSDPRPSLLTSYLAGLLGVGIVGFTVGFLAIVAWLIRD